MLGTPPHVLRVRAFNLSPESLPKSTAERHGPQL